MSASFPFQQLLRRRQGGNSPNNLPPRGGRMENYSRISRNSGDIAGNTRSLNFLYVLSIIVDIIFFLLLGALIAMTIYWWVSNWDVKSTACTNKDNIHELQNETDLLNECCEENRENITTLFEEISMINGSMGNMTLNQLGTGQPITPGGLDVFAVVGDPGLDVSETSDNIILSPNFTVIEENTPLIPLGVGEPIAFGDRGVKSIAEAEGIVIMCDDDTCWIGVNITINGTLPLMIASVGTGIEIPAGGLNVRSLISSDSSIGISNTATEIDFVLNASLVSIGAGASFVGTGPFEVRSAISSDSSLIITEGATEVDFAANVSIESVGTGVSLVSPPLGVLGLIEGDNIDFNVSATDVTLSCTVSTPTRFELNTTTNITVSPYTTTVFARLEGGGGSGGPGASVDSGDQGGGGGGGGSGDARDFWLTVEPGEILTVEIGAGGSASSGGSTSVTGSISGLLATVIGGNQGNPGDQAGDSGGDGGSGGNGYYGGGGGGGSPDDVGSTGGTGGLSAAGDGETGTGEGPGGQGGRVTTFSDYGGASAGTGDGSGGGGAASRFGGSGSPGTGGNAPGGNGGDATCSGCGGGGGAGSNGSATSGGDGADGSAVIVTF